MTGYEIGLQRLSAQAVSDARFASPAEVVSWFGAIQAQDYRGALWAIGLRMKSAVEPEVERAVEERKIVRSWPLRGTLHFVAADDLRWMLAFLAPRIIRLNAARLRRDYELDESIFRQARKILTKRLRDGKCHSRDEIYAALESGSIATGKSRGNHILFQLAHEGFLCFGARAGKQQTFALLEEWLPAGRRLQGDDALHELALRYFRSHAPATATDFSWWSGLPMREARRAAEMVADAPAARPALAAPRYATVFLPAFDEYLVAYKDRSAVLDPKHVRRVNDGGGMLNPTIVIDGKVVATWRRKLKAGSLHIDSRFFRRPSTADRAAVREAARRYGSFLSLPAVVSF